MSTIILASMLSVVVIYAVVITILFLVTEKQYAKYFFAVEQDLIDSEKIAQETVSGLRDLLKLLKDFRVHSLGITKKYDLTNQPDYIHFQKQILSLCYIIEKILSNEG